MNIIKRAWISITRRKVNSLILMLIVFILANVLLTTMSVTMSLNNTKETVLKQLAPVVSIDMDYDKMYSQEGNNEEVEVPKMDGKMAEELYQKTKSMVKSYDYSSWFSLNSKELKNTELPHDESISYGGMEEDGGISISMSGTQMAETSLVDSDMGKIIEGKGFSASDIKDGGNKAIVSKQFAETNNLAVGDVLKLKQRIFDYITEEMMDENTKPVKEIDYELEIVGVVEIDRVEEYIAKANKKSNQSDEYFEVMSIVDVIYAPNVTLNKMQTSDFETLKELHPDEADQFEYNPNDFIAPKYVLKDMKYLDEFISEAKKIYSPDKFAITSASDTYDLAAKPLSSMEDLLNLIFTITVIASIVILTLVLCIFMYLRQKEMGILLALGEPKSKIIGQLLIETLIVAAIGATLAVFTSMIFSNMIADNALQSLLNPADMMEGGMMMRGPGTQNITPELISQQYQGGFTFMTIILFYLTMIGTIVVSQLATALYLLRLNPKKILM